MLATALVLFAAGAAASSPAWGTPPLQPASYRSPSGEWSLEVDPTTRYGAGAADFRATNAGELAWTKRLPFTLRAACIDDRGFVAGHGYDQGWNGVAPNGDFLIAVLSPQGEVLARHAWPMQPGFGIHSAPEPWVWELVPDPHLGVVVFRVMTHERQDSFEEWRIVELSSGRLLECYRPEQRCEFPAGRRAHVVDLLPIPGMEMLAVCWRTSLAPEDAKAVDLCVTAVDLTGRKVAAMELPRELDVAGTERWKRVWSQGTLRAAQGPGAVSLWLPRSDVLAELRFRTIPPDSTWCIEEVGREPAELKMPAPEPDPPAETVELALLESVELQSDPGPQPGPIRDLVAFGFDGPGRLQAVRLDDWERGVFSCLVVDEQGCVLVERQLDPLGGGANVRRTWWPLGHGRWLVTPDTYTGKRTLDAFLVDSSTGEMARGHCVGLEEVESVAATADGGYVVLGGRFGFGSALARYDASGSRLWLTQLAGAAADPSRFCSPHDVTLTPSGLVAIVASSDEAVGLFGPDGSFVARLALDELWEQDPRYPTHIEADGDEGFLVVESPGYPVVRRIGLDGRIHSSLVPRRPDGSKNRWLARGLRRAADGRLWTTDGSALLRLDEDGLADLAIGTQHVVGALTAPVGGAVDPLGRVAILDGATGALHVFDRTGSEVCVAAPLPGDFEGGYGEGEVVGAFDGGLFMKTSALEGGWLAFDARGARLGPVDLGGSDRSGSEDVAFAPDADAYWLHGAPDRDAAVLRDQEQRELARIERRLGRRWLERLESLAVAPSGRVAVLEGLPFSGGGSAVSWFDERGRPVGELTISRTFGTHALATSGAWIAVASYTVEGVFLCRTADRRLMQWSPPAEWSASRGGILGFSPDGRELWLAQPAELTLWRFALPP